MDLHKITMRVAEIERTAYIKKIKGKGYCVMPKDSSSSWRGGCFPTKAEAEKRLSEVEFFKHQGSYSKSRTANVTKYWKTVKSPKTKFIPGYCSNLNDIISSYISAFLSSSDDPEEIVYVMEFNIDTSKLIEVDESLFGFDQDKKLKPGYFGPPDPENDAHPTTDPLNVIVWNEPVTAKMVGAYKVGLSIDPTKGYGSGRYIKNSNYSIDSKTGNWTTKDLKIKIPEKNLIKFKNKDEDDLMIDDKNPENRSEFARKTKNKKYLPEMMKDEDERVRLTVAYYIDLKYLPEMMNDEDVFVRLNVAKRIDPEYLPEMMKDKDERVRNLVAERMDD